MNGYEPDHIIQKQIFDLKLGSVDEAKSLADELERIYNQFIVPLLDDIFTRYDIPGHIIKIDKLEIDLGNIDPGDFEFAIVQQFERVLSRKLAEVLNDHRAYIPNESAPEIIPYTPARIELMSHFLSKGRFPAFAQLDDMELDNLMVELIKTSPAQLKNLLVTQSRRSVMVVRRVVMQFSEPVRHQVYELFAPQHVTYIRRVEQEWKEAAKEISGISVSQFELVLEQAIIAYLLSSPALVFDRKVFLKTLQDYVAPEFAQTLTPVFETTSEVEEVEEVEGPVDYSTQKTEYAVELHRISKWLPDHPLFLTEIPEGERIPAIANLLLDEQPSLLHRLFQEAAFAENEQFVRELVNYMVVRKWTEFRRFLAAPAWNVRPEAVLPVIRIAAAQLMRRAPQKVKELLFELPLPEGPRFLSTPAFRIWQTLFAVEAAPLRQLMLQSRSRRKALERLLTALPTSNRPALFAWVEPMISRPVRIWMEDLQAKIPELKAVLSSPSRPVAVFYAVLLDYGLKPAPNLAQAREFMQELRKEILDHPVITPDLKSEIDLVPLPEIPRVLEEEVESWEEERWEAAEEEKREAAKKAEEEEAAREEAIRKGIETEDQEPEEALASEAGEERTEPRAEPDKSEERVSWKEEKNLMAETKPSALESGISREAQLDFVVHYLRTGQTPWWAETWSHKEINPVMESLLSSQSNLVRSGLKEILTQSRSVSEIRAMVERLITRLSEPVLQALIRMVFPEFSGFIETVVLAFTTYYEAAKRFDLPARPDSYVFRWEPVLTAILGRGESAAEVPTFLARSVEILARRLKKPPTEVKLEVGTLAKEAADQGETRFMPLVHMLKPGALPDLPPDPSLPEDDAFIQYRETAAGKDEETIEKKGNELVEGEEPGQIQKPEKQPEGEEAIQKPEEVTEADTPEEVIPHGEEAEETEELPQKRPEFSDEETVKEKTGEGQEPEDIDLSEYEPMEVVEYFLRHGSLPAEVPVDKRSFEALVKTLFAAPPPSAGKRLIELAANRESRKRMSERFTPEMIEQLIETALPVQAGPLLELIQYWFPLFERSGAPVKKKLLWEQILHYIGSGPIGAFDTLRFLRIQVLYLSRETGKPAINIVNWVQEQIDSPDVSLPTGLVRAFTLLRKDVEKTASRLRSLEGDESKKMAEPEEGEELYIKTAGIVLLHPFLTFFFEKLELVKDKEWVSEDAQRRAVLLLHYVVTKQNSAPEFMLPLNKILCGMEFQEPLEFEFEPTQQEIEFTEALLEAVVNRWTALKNTSQDGLRGAFLVREGKLTFTGTRWILRVDSKPFDMLLDKLTWSINIIKLPWMETILMVEWR